MKAYQEAYIENLKHIASLSGHTFALSGDASVFLTRRRHRADRIRQTARENTDLLQRELFPLLNHISDATPEEIRELEDFAACLWPGSQQPDLVLSYRIHDALLAFARHHADRDMLIRELYYTGMGLFYMQEYINRTGRPCYQWKFALLFGEAASCINQYDEISDPETRGYIHRAMANLALACNGSTLEEGQQKLAAIRRSLNILEDPAYHRKTPSLPWDTFIYKSHQERATALSVLRTGVSDARILREVMESAEYIRERQLESARRQGIQPLARWQMVYEAAQYHCGIRPLSDLLHWLETVFLERDENDYSQDGIYRSIFIPALYADYLSHHPEYRSKKKEVLCYMYRRLVDYVKNVPDSRSDEDMQRDLVSCLWSFVEYPDGIRLKDFLLKLVICRDPDSYVLLCTVAQITRRMAALALREQPELLLGVLDCRSVEQLRDREEDVLRFAFESGMLHNVGRLIFSVMTSRSGRSWLEEEEEMYRYHVYAGELILSRSDSTRPYAATALGHHRFFNGQGGYPQDYDRSGNPNQAVTDLVSVAAYLARLTDTMACHDRDILTLPQALDRVRQQSGTVFSPAAVELLLRLSDELPAILDQGKVEACEEALRLLNR